MCNEITNFPFCNCVTPVVDCWYEFPERTKMWLAEYAGFFTPQRVFELTNSPSVSEGIASLVPRQLFAVLVFVISLKYSLLFRYVLQAFVHGRDIGAELVASKTTV